MEGHEQNTSKHKRAGDVCGRHQESRLKNQKKIKDNHRRHCISGGNSDTNNSHSGRDHCRWDKHQNTYSDPNTNDSVLRAMRDTTDIATRIESAMNRLYLDCMWESLNRSA